MSVTIATDPGGWGKAVTKTLDAVDGRNLETSDTSLSEPDGGVRSRAPAFVPGVTVDVLGGHGNPLGKCQPNVHNSTVTSGNDRVSITMRSRAKTQRRT